MTTRREFLQTTAEITGSLILPTSLFAQPSSNFHFIHAASCKQWPVADPVQWSLENAYKPIPERGIEGFGKLIEFDGDGIVRLIVQRCYLKPLEVREGWIAVDGDRTVPISGPTSRRIDFIVGRGHLKQDDGNGVVLSERRKVRCLNYRF
jgi:hypothetical protein